MSIEERIGALGAQIEGLGRRLNSYAGDVDQMDKEIAEHTREIQCLKSLIGQDQPRRGAVFPRLERVEDKATVSDELAKAVKIWVGAISGLLGLIGWLAAARPEVVTFMLGIGP